MKLLLLCSLTLLFIAVVLSIFSLPQTHREKWFRTMSKRDRLAHNRLVAACGNNPELANKMIAHEQLMNERLSRYHATMAALNRIQNYRRHDRFTTP